MKICLLGSGTASVITTLTFLKFINQHDANIHLTCLYDPSHPTAQVGESTSALVYDTMREVLKVDFADELSEYDGTLRYYTQFFWEDANKNNFSVFYHNPGLHLNSEKWSTYVLSKLKNLYPNRFCETHGKVLGIDQSHDRVRVRTVDEDYEFDYIVDCRGMPSNVELDSELYETDVFQSVNSVILFPDFTNYRENHTSSFVHRNGWMFGVPLTHRKAFGYLYNNNYTTYEEAVKDFSRIKNIDASKLRNFSWRQYYKITALDNRILSMGNKLYFLEPQGAIPLHYYELLADGFINGVIKNVSNQRLEQVVNKFHSEAMIQIQDLIAFGYCGENNIDSKFWNNIKKRSVEWLKKSKNWQNWLRDVEVKKEILGYAPTDSSMMKTYIRGYKIHLDSLKDLNNENEQIQN